MPLSPIRSRDNPSVKALRQLIGLPRYRRQQGECWVEGSRLVEAALDAVIQKPQLGWRVSQVVWAAGSEEGPDPVQAAIIARAVKAGGQSLALDTAVFRFVSGVESPQGIGLVLQRSPVGDAGPQIAPGVSPDILILDGLQDPGNLGSMIRTAVAAGVGRVLVNTASTEAFSPKALRAGAGAQFLVPIEEGLTTEALIQDLIEADYTVALTVPPAAPGARSLFSLEITARLCHAQPLAWVLGQEGQGVSAGWEALAQLLRITIPHRPQVESLNVTAAAAVILFERLRCRRS